MVVLRESEESLNQLFRALADGTRRDILARSLTETLSVSDLAARYGMSFAAAQKHVAVPGRAGLVQKRANGREQLVSTNRARLQRAGELLDSFESIWHQRVAQLDDVLLPTSVTKDPEKLTLTVVADFPVPQKRLWDAWADPLQLARFWGPPFAPATFTYHDFKVGGRAEYFLTGPKGEKWSGLGSSPR
jgi:DNA-binding transcriptional ArsR family regulator